VYTIIIGESFFVFSFMELRELYRNRCVNRYAYNLYVSSLYGNRVKHKSLLLVYETVYHSCKVNEENEFGVYSLFQFDKGIVVNLRKREFDVSENLGRGLICGIHGKIMCYECDSKYHPMSAKSTVVADRLLAAFRSIEGFKSNTLVNRTFFSRCYQIYCNNYDNKNVTNTRLWAVINRYWKYGLIEDRLHTNELVCGVVGTNYLTTPNHLTLREYDFNKLQRVELFKKPGFSYVEMDLFRNYNFGDAGNIQRYLNPGKFLPSYPQC